MNNGVKMPILGYGVYQIPPPEACERCVLVIPKSTRPERMAENFNMFDFVLSAEEMAAIEGLDTAESLFFSHQDPKNVEWFMSIL